MQKIAFIPNHNWKSPETRGSSIMRACVVSAYMKQTYESLIDVRYSKFLPKDFEKNDIVIFVKDFTHPDIKVAKQKGCIVVYDPIDDQNIFNSEIFDIVISSSKSHADVLIKRCNLDSKKIISIDHLHTNTFRKKTKERKKEEIVTIGSVTPVRNLGIREDDCNLLKNFIASENAVIKEFTDTNYILSNDFREVINLHERYVCLDIGLALYDFSMEPSRKKEKPSTKLSAFSSYGIPAVLTYQESYSNVIEIFPELENYVVFDIEQVKKILKKLILDFDYYLYSKNLFDEIGEFFHMKNSYKLYVEQINETYQNNKKT
jgi:hypothetical protein